MRIFVISLPESIERRSRIARQLSMQGVPFSFFDAINLNNDRNRYFHHCAEERFLLNTGRTPTAGELGCFASHLMLWRTCRLLDEPILILEDDAEIAGEFAAALPFVERYIRRCGFIRLQHNGKRGKKAIVCKEQRRLDFCTRFPHGSLAYTISPAVADAFIEQSQVFRAPVDVFIKRYWRHGQPLFSIAPALAGLSNASAVTTIQKRGQTRVPFELLARRWWHKRRDFVSRAVFNMRWLRANGKNPVQGFARDIRLAVFKGDS